MSTSFLSYPEKPFVDDNFTTNAVVTATNALPESNRHGVMAALRCLQQKIRRLESEREKAEENLRQLSSTKSFLSHAAQTDNGTLDSKLEEANFLKIASEFNEPSKALGKDLFTFTAADTIVACKSRCIESQLRTAEKKCQSLEFQLDSLKTLVDQADGSRTRIQINSLAPTSFVCSRNLFPSGTADNTSASQPSQKEMSNSTVPVPKLDINKHRSRKLINELGNQEELESQMTIKKRTSPMDQIRLQMEKISLLEKEHNELIQTQKDAEERIRMIERRLLEEKIYKRQIKVADNVLSSQSQPSQSIHLNSFVGGNASVQPFTLGDGKIIASSVKPKVDIKKRPQQKHQLTDAAYLQTSNVVKHKQLAFFEASGKRTKLSRSAEFSVLKQTQRKYPNLSHYHLGDQIPFVAGQSTSPSHSLAASLQTVLHLMKQHNPLLCSAGAASGKTERSRAVSSNPCSRESKEHRRQQPRLCESARPSGSCPPSVHTSPVRRTPATIGKRFNSPRYSDCISNGAPLTVPPTTPREGDSAGISAGSRSASSANSPRTFVHSTAPSAAAYRANTHRRLRPASITRSTDRSRTPQRRPNSADLPPRPKKSLDQKALSKGHRLSHSSYEDTIRSPKASDLRSLQDLLRQLQDEFSELCLEYERAGGLSSKKVPNWTDFDTRTHATVNSDAIAVVKQRMAEKSRQIVLLQNSLKNAEEKQTEDSRQLLSQSRNSAKNYQNLYVYQQVRQLKRRLEKGDVCWQD